MTVFKLNSRGPRVAELQQRLRQKGFDPGSETGVYTADTEAAVRSFQEKNGLGVDGVAGPNTIAALSAALSPGGTIRPVCPSAIVSAMPPTDVAITGFSKPSATCAMPLWVASR